ncbi:MAG: pyrroline-5-carboxylate reductase [Rhizobiales bacterium]|nr:pyrroline-5-carboxylate reductase [Hyphomicrobiales bacterium]
MNSDFSICLIGAGNMGGAMLAGWLESGISTERINVVDPVPSEKMVAIFAETGVDHFTSATDAPISDVLIVAVKPQIIQKVLPSLTNMIGENTVVVSVAAGTTISTIGKHAGDVAIVRAMPNTPSLMRRGMTGCFANGRTVASQVEQVTHLLSAIGKVVWVENESQIDAVTAVSGSGPAYVFHLAECMAKAGVEAGLPEAVAEMLARETIAGAGEMLSQLEDSSAQLRKNVTSPNGTTAAALDVFMNEQKMQSLVSQAIMAAKKRSEELS